MPDRGTTVDNNTTDPRVGTATRDFRTWLALGVVLSALFMSQIDLFIINVAMPSIQASLDASFGESQFFIDGYVIAYAALMVLGGRLGDRYGRKRIFIRGVLAFIATSLCCALSPTPLFLVVARVLQGLSAAVMTPQVLSIIRTLFDDKKSRGRAVGAYGSSIGLGVIVGLIAGGGLLQLDVGGLGWRMIFLINVPIGLAVLVSGQRLIPETRSSNPPMLDPIGAGMTGLILPALLVPVTVGAEFDWPWWIWVSFAAAGILLVVFFRWERALESGGRNPLLPTRLLRTTSFPTSMATVFVFFAGNSGLFLVLTYHLQSGLALDPMSTSLVFTPLGVGFVVSSTMSRRLAEQFGLTVALAGGALMAIALASVPFITGQAPTHQYVPLAVMLALSGLGQGFVVAPVVGRILSRLTADDAGAGSGVLNTVNQIGMASGVAAVGALYRAQLGTNPQTASGRLPLAQFGHAFNVSSFLLAALALCVVAITAAVMIQVRTAGSATS